MAKKSLLTIAIMVEIIVVLGVIGAAVDTYPILIILNNSSNNVTIHPVIYCTAGRTDCGSGWINISNPTGINQSLNLELMVPTNTSGRTFYYYVNQSETIANKVYNKNDTWILPLEVIPTSDNQTFAFKVVYRFLNGTNTTDIDEAKNKTYSIITIATPTPPINLTEINDTLNDILNNLTNNTNITNNFTNIIPPNGSICFNTEETFEYTLTQNGTNISTALELRVEICYANETIYCSSNSSTQTTLLMINISNYSCNSGTCKGAEVLPNPYYIGNISFNQGYENVSFICLGKKKQDGNFLWAYRAMNFEDENNVFYFDFSNSSFVMNEYNVTNSTVYNVTNNITNNITNEFYNNITFTENITNDIINNITADLSELEERIGLLESWKIEVEETLKSLISIIDTLTKLLERNIFLIDLSGSNFTDNNYLVTEETVYNVTNNLTNNITNNYTQEMLHIYNVTNNITNNITSPEITGLEARVSALETWREQVTVTLNYVVKTMNEIMIKVTKLFG